MRSICQRQCLFLKVFVFEVKKGDQAFNQKNYEEIGDIITEYVYGLLESDPLNLKRQELGNDAFVYISEDFESNDNLCILIHGYSISTLFELF